MIQEWKEHKIKEFCEFKYGKNLPTSKRIHGQYPVYGSSGITGWHNDYLIEGPGIIIGRKGTVGKVQFSKYNFYPIDTTYYISEDKSKVDLKYLYYRLPLCGMDGMNSDAAIPGLNRTAATSLKINLPPLPTQRKIATILSAYDDLIENNLKRIKLLEEKAQLTYEEWFVRMKFPGHETAVFDEESGLPEGWGKVKMKDTSIKIGDGNYSSKYPRSEDFIAEGIPFFSTREMENGRLSTEGVKRISLAQHNTLLKGHLIEGDIILSTRGSIGKIAFVDKVHQGGNINAQLVLFRCDNSSIFNSFLFYQLSSPNSYKMLLNVGTGTAQPQLPIKTLHLFEILYPSPSLQQEFHLKIYPQMKIVAALLNQNQFLKEARDVLLPRLMTGMIDVAREAAEE